MVIKKNSASNIDIQELLELGGDLGESSIVKSVKQAVHQHQVFFDEDIGEPKKYRDLINMLYMSTEHDEFNFFINSSGGYLSSATAIIEAIGSSDATVRAIITGECHSAASIIALSCHEIIVTDSSHMLVHTSSYGAGGNAHVVQKHVDFSTKYINRILDSVYGGFLTVEELEQCKLGVEYWFDSEEIGARLLNRVEYQKALAIENEKPVKKTRAKK